MMSSECRYVNKSVLISSVLYCVSNLETNTIHNFSWVFLIRQGLVRIQMIMDEYHYFSCQVDELRGSPMSVGNLEEIIDDNHAIVSTR
jgi:hypothetical protein